MHDAQRLAARSQPFVRVVQALGGGGDDRDRVRERQRRARLVALARGARLRAQHLAHVRAVDVLHREERRVAVGADVVDLDDVRVRQRRRQARLVEEHAQQLGIQRVLRQDPLEHDELLEALDADAGHAREEDLRHAADGQAPDRLIPTDALAAVDAGRDSLHGSRISPTRGDRRARLGGSAANAPARRRHPV